MTTKGITDFGDLTGMAKLLLKVIQSHIKRKVAFVVCFTAEPHFDRCSWIGNIEDADITISLLRETADVLERDSQGTIH